MSSAESTDPLVNALRRKVKNQEERIDELESTITELETVVDKLQERAPDPSRMDYEDMDRADKVTVVRSKLKAEAEATNGTAKAEYKDVIRMFDGHPSAGHAYQLMEAAGSKDGCNYNEAPDGTKRVTYRVGGVNN
jgi:predicted RNase H-like nuclease (RuvC/YqgF family)